MGDSIATEFKRIFYTLTCDECGKPIVINLQIDELLNVDYPASPHRQKGKRQGGLWRSTQHAIVRHHQTHSIPEPVDSDGLTHHMRVNNAMR